jgi:malic enzyme
MIIGVFKYVVNEAFREEFDRLYDEMAGHVAQIEGYEGHKIYSGSDGENVVIVEFSDIDAWLICLDRQDSDEIIRTVRYLAPTFGGVNLEDIAAPQCFRIEVQPQDLGILPSPLDFTVASKVAAAVSETASNQT